MHRAKKKQEKNPLNHSIINQAAGDLGCSLSNKGLIMEIFIMRFPSENKIVVSGIT